MAKKRTILIGAVGIGIFVALAAATCGDSGDPTPENSANSANNQNSTNNTNNSTIPLVDLSPEFDSPMVVMVETDTARFLPDISLTGFAFGVVESLRYETSTGGSGDLTFDKSGWTLPLTLSKGDTTVTVIASGAGETVSDSITLTYHPVTVIELDLSTRGVFQNGTSPVIAHARVGGEALSVDLVEVDAQGAVVQTLSPLRDDGLGPDENAGDFRFAATFTPDAATVRSLYIRAAADVNGETVFSPVKILHVLREPTADEKAALVSLPQAAADWYEAHLAASDETTARASTLADLLAHPHVAEAAVSADGDAISWRFTSGVQGMLVLRDEGRQSPRGTDVRQQAVTTPPRIGSNNAILLAPFHTEFDDACEGCRSEADEIKNSLDSSFCPELTVIDKRDFAAGVNAFKTIGGQGLVIIASHGSRTIFWAGDFYNPWGRTVEVEAIATAEAVGAENVDTFMIELLLKDIIIMGLRRAGYPVFAITPTFVTHYVGSLPQSIVYVAACRSMYAGAMNAAFLAKGAKGYIGFEGVLLGRYAADVGEELFERLATRGETVDQALNLAITIAEGRRHGISYVGDTSVKIADQCSGWTRIIERLQFPGKSVTATYNATETLQTGTTGVDVVQTTANCTYVDTSRTEVFGQVVESAITGSGSIVKTHAPPHIKYVIRPDNSIDLVPMPIDDVWISYTNWVSGTTPFRDEAGCRITGNMMMTFPPNEVTITDAEVRGSKTQSVGGGSLQIDFRYRR